MGSCKVSSNDEYGVSSINPLIRGSLLQYKIAVAAPKFRPHSTTFLHPKWPITYFITSTTSLFSNQPHETKSPSDMPLPEKSNEKKEQLARKDGINACNDSTLEPIVECK